MVDFPFPPAEQRTFVSFDGTPIGYQVLGREDGIPMLVANGLGGTWRTWSHFITAFSDTFRFIVWDYRGMFTSGRPIHGKEALSVAHQAKDAAALLEHEGVDHFFAIGWSMGVQVLLELHRHLSPDRFRALILHNGVAGLPYNSVLHSSKLGAVTPKALRFAQRFDGLVTKSVNFAVGQSLLVPALIRTGFLHHDVDRAIFTDMVNGWRELDMHLYMDTLAALGVHDASDQLPRVRCPTVLIAGTHDAMTPMKAAENIVETIRDATMEVIPAGTHHAAFEQPELLNSLVTEFFQRRFAGVLKSAAA